MSKESFSDLGVFEPTIAALSRRSIHTPFSIQSLVIPDALAGNDVLAKSPTGSGKTLAFALPIVQRLDAGDERPSASSSSRPGARDTGRGGLRGHWAIGGSTGHSRVRRDIRVRAGEGGEERAYPRRNAGPARGPREPPPREARRHPHPRPRRSGSDARHGLPAPGRRDRPQASSQAPDDVLLGHARRPGRRAARAYTHNPSRFDVELPSQVERGATEHRFVGVTAENKVETLVEMLGHDDGLTLVFVRTKRGADRLVQRLRRHEVKAVAMHGDMNQRARERASPSSKPARSRRSSRPTWRHAVSTSTTSRT